MESDTVKLAPSILAADFARLGEQVAEAEKAGANRIHVDIMDGHFVPNLSMGAPIVQSLRHVTRLPLETHLMISNPDFFLEEFVQAGSDSFLIHWEGNNNLHRTVWKVKELGRKVGVVINPSTPCIRAGRDPAGPGPGCGHDGRSRLRTSTLPAQHTAEDQTCSRNDRQPSSWL